MDVCCLEGLISDKLHGQGDRGDIPAITGMIVPFSFACMMALESLLSLRSLVIVIPPLESLTRPPPLVASLDESGHLDKVMDLHCRYDHLCREDIHGTGSTVD
jgi:hypothetical protein